MCAKSATFENKVDVAVDVRMNRGEAILISIETADQ